MKLTAQQKIYLGDRAITRFLIDSIKRNISIEFDCISIFSTQHWIPGKSLDIDRGVIECKGVKSYDVSPTGFIPNDFIIDITLSNSTLVINTIGELYNKSTSEYEIIEGFLKIDFDDYLIKTKIDL